MKPKERPLHFAGFDWAKTHHDVTVIDANGEIVVEFRFDHHADGWRVCEEKLKPFVSLAVAIEAGNIHAIERLARMGYRVYVVHPKSSKAYRMRKQPTGSKTDKGDCLALAQALRFEGETWNEWSAPAPLSQELRTLCRDELALIGQRTALVNQLIHTLYDYYPTALEAFDDWTAPSAWAFVVQFPTSALLVKAGKRRWENFLHAHRCYHECNYEKRLGMFAKAESFQGSDAMVAAKSTLAVALAKMLQTLEVQLSRFRERIEDCFLRHPCHAIFASLPGAGPKLAPRLLAEMMCMPDCTADPQWLQSQAGMAPVSYQSGQILVVYLRRHCNQFLRHAVHLWADQSRRASDWAQVYYRAHRAKGQSHACALRCLGMRWLRIVSALVRNQKAYDAALHEGNQRKHGSWIAALKAESGAA
jgi:transposase